MTDGLSAFKTSEHAYRYVDLYDDIVARRWPVARDELDVPTRFGETHVRRSGGGDGTPLVMIHPTAGSSAGWYPVIASLCERRPAYTPDTIGTAGRSVQAKPIRSSRDLVTWVDDVLDALALPTVHLLGYSEGGWIAGLHAALSPRRDRVRTLTLIEPSGAIGRVPTRFVAGMVGRGARVLLARDKPRAVRRFNRWMNGDIELTDDQIGLLLSAMGTFRQKLPRPELLTDEEIARISMPTLLLIAADTKLYDPDAVRARARRLMPDVTAEVTPDAGHGLLFQYPELITRRIVHFIDDHDHDHHDVPPTVDRSGE